MTDQTEELFVASLQIVLRNKEISQKGESPLFSKVKSNTSVAKLDTHFLPKMPYLQNYLERSDK
jgi:hypothetical protein